MSLSSFLSRSALQLQPHYQTLIILPFHRFAKNHLPLDTQAAKQPKTSQPPFKHHPQKVPANTMPHTDPPEPEKYEPIIVHYDCGCVEKCYQLQLDDANYPEPTEIWLKGDCWRCEEDHDREGAAAAAAAAEAARRRRAGLRGRLRGMVRGRTARVP